MTYLQFLDDPNAHKFIDELFIRSIADLKEKSENKLAKVLEKLSKNYVEKFKYAYDGQNGDFLTHGDIWSNNVMFDGYKGILLC